jgi:2,4-dienoyl-CoA reductase-like NADH-dependent reductase (Old Yellow Enzyme family)
MAPMTRQKSRGGIPGPEVAAYYRRRAESGTGLIITEGTVVDDPVSTMNVDIPNFYGPALDGWLRVVDAVHEVGGKIMPQLWHVGMARNPAKAPHPELPSAGPSGLTMRGFPGLTQPGLQHSEPMTREHIRRVVEAFGQAAADAQRLGFDGVEIHGAHGYLIDQFFWVVTNQRADEYGGDLVTRTRFAVEIIEAVRRATGPDFPIILRFSQWKQQDYAARLATTPEELARFLAPLSTAGVDIFHCSQRRFWEPEFEGSDLNLAGWTKKLTVNPPSPSAASGCPATSSARCTANLPRAPGSTTCSTGWSATSSIWSRSVARCWSTRPGRARCRRPATTSCCPSSPRRSRHCPDSPGP